MSSILCLWKYKNYLKDMNEGIDEENPAYNSHSSRLHSATSFGERAYVVTYVDRHCYLLERIIITEKYPNEPSYEYGAFGISGVPPESQCFDLGLIDVTNILRQLNFKTGKRIGNTQLPLSFYLQNLRELTDDDVALLESCIP